MKTYPLVTWKASSRLTGLFHAFFPFFVSTWRTSMCPATMSTTSLPSFSLKSDMTLICRNHFLWHWSYWTPLLWHWSYYTPLLFKHWIEIKAKLLSCYDTSTSHVCGMAGDVTERNNKLRVRWTSNSERKKRVELSVLVSSLGYDYDGGPDIFRQHLKKTVKIHRSCSCWENLLYSVFWIIY